MKKRDSTIMTISCTVGWRNDVVRLADQLGISVSLLMRQAMNEYATRNGAKLDNTRRPHRGRPARIIEVEE